jgi:hypothetical protein
VTLVAQSSSALNGASAEALIAAVRPSLVVTSVTLALLLVPH